MVKPKRGHFAVVDINASFVDLEPVQQMPTVHGRLPLPMIMLIWYLPSSQFQFTQSLAG